MKQNRKEVKGAHSLVKTTYVGSRQVRSQLGVARLITTAQARNGQDDEASVGVLAARNVTELVGEHIDGDETSVLAVSAIEGVGASAVDVHLGEHDAVGGIHGCVGVKGRG